MKIELCSLGLINNNINFNKDIILNSIKNSKADLLVFGEMFLQGFMSISFNYEVDKNIAIEQNDQIINEIISECKKYHIAAVSFGYAEIENNHIYSSQITINKNGHIISNYRRISKGWKETYADEYYLEGNNVCEFSINNIKFALALCGDLWDENIVARIKKVKPDVVL